jgi:hypothetical protein
MKDDLVIRFPNANLAQANRLAETLRTAILNAAPDANVQRRKESQESMDFGATLGITLAGPAVVAVAKGMKAWLERHHGVGGAGRPSAAARNCSEPEQLPL